MSRKAYTDSPHILPYEKITNCILIFEPLSAIHSIRGMKGDKLGKGELWLYSYPSVLGLNVVFSQLCTISNIAPCTSEVSTVCPPLASVIWERRSIS